MRTLIQKCSVSTYFVLTFAISCVSVGLSAGIFEEPGWTGFAIPT